jgi:hypothetical protein
VAFSHIPQYPQVWLRSAQFPPPAAPGRARLGSFRTIALRPASRPISQRPFPGAQPNWVRFVHLDPVRSDAERRSSGKCEVGGQRAGHMFFPTRHLKLQTCTNLLINVCRVPYVVQKSKNRRIFLAPRISRMSPFPPGGGGGRHFALSELTAESQRAGRSQALAAPVQPLELAPGSSPPKTTDVFGNPRAPALPSTCAGAGFILPPSDGIVCHARDRCKDGPAPRQPHHARLTLLLACKAINAVPHEALSSAPVLSGRCGNGQTPSPVRPPSQRYESVLRTRAKSRYPSPGC